MACWLVFAVVDHAVELSSSFGVCVPIVMGLACLFNYRVNRVVEDLSVLTVTNKS